jgi:hypothetical protein
MAKLSETDVREMLRCRADDVVMAPVPSDAVLRGSARRKARNAVLASAATLAIVAMAVGVVLSTGGSSRPPDSPTGGRSAGRALGTPPATIGDLRLVDYTLGPAKAGNHAHAGSGPTITIDEVRRHVSCMRSQGFNLPDPTRQPGGGWSVIVEDPKAHGLDFRSRKFREAEFVTCGPIGGPLSGELVGGPRPKIDRFMSCMSRQGFDLPRPTKDTSGNHDIDEWQFDLTRTRIDTSTRAWNRAMFVVGAPEDI